MKSGSWREICIPVFTAAQSVTANMWKPCKRSSTEGWRKRGVCIERNTVQPWKRSIRAVCHSTDEPGGHCAQWEKHHRRTDTTWVYLQEKSKLVTLLESKSSIGTPLAVQWLKLGLPVWGVSSTPGWGAKIPICLMAKWPKHKTETIFQNIQ